LAEPSLEPSILPKRAADKPAAVAPRLGSGRPTAEQAEAIDAAIFDAARRLFLTLGFEQTSMEAVAEAANISRTTLYARHKSKEGLLRAVVDAQVQAWGRAQRMFRDPLPKEFKQRMHHHARAVIQMMISDEVRAFRKLTQSAANGDPKYAQLMKEVGYLPAIEALAQEISDGCRDLPVPPRNAMGVAEMLMGLLNGWAVARADEHETATDEAIAYADQAVDIMFFGRAAW
jgi:TetR/AcrR family transcriptional repressor of mexJK operon